MPKRVCMSCLSDYSLLFSMKNNEQDRKTVCSQSLDST